MYTVREVAKRLNIAASTVYELIQAGKLAALRFGAAGGTLRVTEDDLQAYISGARYQVAAIEAPVVNVPLKHLR